MILRKRPEASLKLRQPVVQRVTLVLSLFFIIVVFVAFPRFKPSKARQIEYRVEIQTSEVPIIQQQMETAKPPSRPSIPIESDNEDLSEDITIDPTTDFSSYQAWEAPPPPPPEEHQAEGPRVKFIPYDEPPEPIGGFAAIQRNIVYPEIAQEAGIEGQVIVQAYINEFGKVTECVVLKGVPNTGLDEAAIAAIMKTRFKPAKQRDRNVGVYISIPVIFKLKSN